MKILLIILYIFIFSSTIVIAEEEPKCRISISGYLVNGENNLPLEGVSVAIKELNIGAITNAQGFFKISNLCKGKYTVVYQNLGYKTFSTIYDLNISKDDKILLHTDTCELPSVTIYGLKDEELVTLTKNTLEGKALDRTRGLNLGESLKQIPGMFTFQTGPSISKPVLHGMHSNRLLIMNAGLRQEGQQWGAEHAPEIDPFISNKLEVVKGAAGLRYGSDAIAGVIIVEPKPLKNISDIGGELNLGGFSNNRMGVASATLEGNVQKIPELKWRIQGSYKVAGNSSTPDYILSNTAYKEDNFSATLGYIKPNYGLEVYFSRFHTQLGILPNSQPGNVKDLQTAISRSRPSNIEGFTYTVRRGYQNVAHDLLKVKAFYNFKNFGKISLTLGQQWNKRQEYDRHQPLIDSIKNNPQYDFNLITQSAELVLDHYQSNGFSGQFGLVGQSQIHIQNGTRTLIPNFISNSVGVFAIEKWKKNRLELETGIRYDLKQYSYLFKINSIYKDSNYVFQNFSGNLGLNYQLSKNLIWKNNIGLTFRPPTPNEMFVNGQVHGSVFVEVGNSRFKAEQGYKFISTIEFKSSKLSFEGTIHYSYIANYIYLRPTLFYRNTAKGEFLEFVYTQTNASFYGIDLNLIYSPTSQFDVIAKGSAVNAINETFGNYLVYIPPYRGEISAVYSPNFAYFLKKNAIYLQVSGVFTARQFRVENNSDFLSPPAGYGLLNTEIGGNFKVGKQPFFVSIQANNLLNTSYRDYMNRYRYFADEPGRNIILRLKIPLSIYKYNS